MVSVNDFKTVPLSAIEYLGADNSTGERIGWSECPFCKSEIKVYINKSNEFKEEFSEGWFCKHFFAVNESNNFVVYKEAPHGETPVSELQ